VLGALAIIVAGVVLAFLAVVVLTSVARKEGLTVRLAVVLRALLLLVIAVGIGNVEMVKELAGAVWRPCTRSADPLTSLVACR
jgi:hypothetical protein